MHALKMLPSRTGAAFGAEITEEPDGTLSILSNDGSGYRSAHRDYARQAGFSRRIANLRWVNLHGVRVVLTRWGA